MQSVAAIDGDVLVYRTGFAGQQTLVSAVLADGSVIVDGAKNKTECLQELERLGVPEHDCSFRKEVTLDSANHVVHSLNVQLERIMDCTRASKFHVFLTGSGNFRSVLAKTLPYKGNRVAEKPEYYEFLREKIKSRWKGTVVPGAEADDAIAIKGAEGAVMCTLDKDLRQVPGLHFNWTKDLGIEEVNVDDGTLFLFQQALAGDSTDNIPGIPGIGLKKAEKYLLEMGCYGRTFTQYIQACEGFYGIHGLQPERFVECFNLVYMCRTIEELRRAKQIASEGGPGLSPESVEAARLCVPTV